MSDIRTSILTVTGSDNPFTLGLSTDRDAAADHARSLMGAIAEDDLCDDYALEAYDLCQSLTTYGRAF